MACVARALCQLVFAMFGVGPSVLISGIKTQEDNITFAMQHNNLLNFRCRRQEFDQALFVSVPRAAAGRNSRIGKKTQGCNESLTLHGAAQRQAIDQSGR